MWLSLPFLLLISKVFFLCRQTPSPPPHLRCHVIAFECVNIINTILRCPSMIIFYNHTTLYFIARLISIILIILETLLTKQDNCDCRWIHRDNNMRRHTHYFLSNILSEHKSGKQFINVLKRSMI